MKRGLSGLQGATNTQTAHLLNEVKRTQQMKANVITTPNGTNKTYESDILITVTGIKPGADSAILSEYLANFLHCQGLQVEIAGHAVQHGNHYPQAVTIRTATRVGGAA